MLFINTKYCIVSCVKRQIHLCSVLKYSENREARMLAKLMTGSHRKRKNWYRSELMAKTPTLPSGKSFQSGSQSNRRLDVLNKLFMRSITDLLATGEVVPELVGLSVSITQVKVLSDFSVVNVYWTSSHTVHDEKLDQILKKAGFDLRHHLCQLHVMGIVPKICFVADKWQNISEKTFQTLEKVKSEKGYDSEDSAEQFKSQYTLNESVDPKILDKLENLEEDFDTFPPMNHNVLGLDHATIMSKIKVAVNKSEARHRKESMGDDISLVLPSDETVQSSSFDPSYISQYIRKKRIEEKKSRKELQKELLTLTELNSQSSEEYVDIEDEDFIDEFQDMMNNSSELRET